MTMGNAFVCPPWWSYHVGVMTGPPQRTVASAVTSMPGSSRTASETGSRSAAARGRGGVGLAMSGATRLEA